MAKTSTNRAGLSVTEQASEIARKRGHSSLYAMCVAERASYVLIHRTLSKGTTKGTHKGTLDELKRLGLLELVRDAG